VRVLYFLTFSFFFFATSFCAQLPDSVGIKNDSLQTILQIDSFNLAKKTVEPPPLFELKKKLLNTDQQSVFFAADLKQIKSKDSIFYFIVCIVLFLAFLKYFHKHYFTNLFRVFFNTSLRQSQLTDQLLQAKLPSLLFNIFFMISAGMYLYLLLSFYQLINVDNSWKMIFSSIVLVGVIYFLKFCILKFTGWITGFKEMTNTYVFVIFLINKIIGIFLIPFIVIMTFSDFKIVKISILISLISVVIFLLLRFFRSYGLLQNQLKMSKAHFFLYILGIEILPLLLTYKGLMVYLSKNL